MLLFPGKGEDFAKPLDAHAVTRTFVRHAKKLGFEMRFHDIRASHLTILLDNGVAVPTVNARNTPIRANIVGPSNVATRIKASIVPANLRLRERPSGARCSRRHLLSVDNVLPSGRVIGSSKGQDQSAMMQP
jgi:hypothetical protein